MVRNLLPPPTDHPLEWLRHQAKSRGSAPALIEGPAVLDYAGLWDSLGRWARTMNAAGLEPGKITAVASASRSRLARAIFLAIYAGFPILPVSPPLSGFGRLMRHCAIQQAIVDADVDLPQGILRLPARYLETVGHSPPAGPSPLPWDQVQMLVASSGTEGPIRAAMLSGSNLAESALATNEAVTLCADDRWLCCLPLNHVGGIMILLRCAAAGAACVLHGGFTTQAAKAAIESQGISHASLVPPMLHRLIDAGTDADHLTCVLIGGSPLSAPLAQRARKRSWPLRLAYGLTETAAHIALGAADTDDPFMDIQAGTRVRIVDAENDSGVGSIEVSGPTVMLGYANPGLVPGHGLVAPGTFRTQDLGRLDRRGRLQVLGRGDDVLISGGVNVHPAQVEDLLSGCPGVGEVAVTGYPDPVWGTCLVALYIGDGDVAAVEAWSKDHLPSQIRPRMFKKVDEMPRTQLGKVRRGELNRLLDDS